MSTRTKRVIGGVVVLIVLAVLVGTLFNGSEPKATEASGNDVAKTEIASLKEQNAQIRKQHNDLKKMVIMLQKKLATIPTRKIVPATAKAPTPTPIVRAPESAAKMLKAMGIKAQTEDRIIKVWTGLPAIIHELARANAKKAEAQKPARVCQTASDTVRGARLAEAEYLEKLAETMRQKARRKTVWYGKNSFAADVANQQAATATKAAAEARAEVDR